MQTEVGVQKARVGVSLLDGSSLLFTRGVAITLKVVFRSRKAVESMVVGWVRVVPISLAIIDAVASTPANIGWVRMIAVRTGSNLLENVAFEFGG